MLKLSTTVAAGRAAKAISLKDNLFLLGSCFVDNMADKFKDAGFKTVNNPFGTIYNPASIAQAVELLDSQRLFTEADCVQMGSGMQKICSFYHHSSFARTGEQEFLENANKALEEARESWHKTRKVIISLGSAMVWEHIEQVEIKPENNSLESNSPDNNGPENNSSEKRKPANNGIEDNSLENNCSEEIKPEDNNLEARKTAGKRLVSNCLKRPGYEFEHRMLSLDEVKKSLKDIVEAHPEKDFIFTVSPIRHLGDGAHQNTLSKSLLHLAIADLGLEYFPAYEIVLDELRDYRFFAEDLVHPSKTTVDILWEKFLDYACLPEERASIEQNEKDSKYLKHVRRD
ncbi:MAG: GSCFA domain-containing protein [Candidatus Cryptobacteroides sp.]